MNDQKWNQAYLAAQRLTESKLGALTLNSTQIRTVNTWVRYGLTTNTAPDVTSMYFGIYDELPPEGFGSPKSIKAFIARAHEVQGLPSLTQSEGDQIDALVILTFRACEMMMESNSQTSSSGGCASVFVLLIMVTSERNL
ncbi:MAG: hypothetical protein ABGY11_12515 [Candidatus Thioglobus sp.]